jgi:hypothetical protein
MGDLLAPAGTSSGQTRLSEWLADNRERVGTRYASEVARHYTMGAKAEASVLCEKHENAV